MDFYLEASCGCNVGRLRKNNEDNFYFNGQILPQENKGIDIPMCQRVNQETVCYAVFDGMGGEADGQIASYLAANTFQKDCESIERGGLLSESFFSSVVNHMNNAVYLKAEQLNNHMGTTAAMIGFCEDSIYLCNIGDSRIYRFRQGRLTQISMDHTESIPPFLRNSANRKPRLSQCIGISPEELVLEPYIAQGSAKMDDIYVISSDGMTDMLSEQEILNILNNTENVVTCVEKLIDKSLMNGGKDNVTVIVIKVTKNKTR